MGTIYFGAVDKDASYINLIRIEHSTKRDPRKRILRRGRDPHSSSYTGASIFSICSDMFSSSSFRMFDPVKGYHSPRKAGMIEW